jgi:hypothetical protein
MRRHGFRGSSFDWACQQTSPLNDFTTIVWSSPSTLKLLMAALRSVLLVELRLQKVLQRQGNEIRFKLGEHRSGEGGLCF